MKSIKARTRVASRTTSVRKQTADRTARQQILSHPAKYPLSQSCVPIGAGNYQIDGLFFNQSEQCARGGALDWPYPFRYRCDPMARKVFRDVFKTIQRFFLTPSLRYFHDDDFFCTDEERQSIPNGATRFSGALPCDHHALCCERLDAKRNSKYRSPGPQNQRTGIRRTVRIVRFTISADDMRIDGKESVLRTVAGDPANLAGAPGIGASPPPAPSVP